MLGGDLSQILILPFFTEPSQAVLCCPVSLGLADLVSYPGQFSGIPVCGILATRKIAQILKLLNSQMFLLFQEIMYNGEEYF